jgi:hypothetical protein
MALQHSVLVVAVEQQMEPLELVVVEGAERAAKEQQVQEQTALRIPEEVVAGHSQTQMKPASRAVLVAQGL